MRRPRRIWFPQTTPQWKDVVGEPKLSFRRARPEDATGLAEVCAGACATYGEWAPAGWQQWSESAAEIEARLELPGWCLIAAQGRAPVGYVVLKPADEAGVASIWHLFVLPAWWGKGVARELLASAMTEARRQGYDEAMLRTPRDNARARRFYEREGWSATGASIFAPHIGLDLVEYRRMLRP